ncbi:hypothetical protein HDF09_001298 [Edaphobacter lichenicola]|uniref:Uncharacterized protein n=1 Tax=Tunturiibacter empetritectus TaxID=3069691 RepID=A0A7W8IG72_9BACT|nr:hypothetical protein [Edaphobacter lichenicola]
MDLRRFVPGRGSEQRLLLNLRAEGPPPIDIMLYNRPGTKQFSTITIPRQTCLVAVHLFNATASLDLSPQT